MGISRIKYLGPASSFKERQLRRMQGGFQGAGQLCDMGLPQPSDEQYSPDFFYPVSAELWHNLKLVFGCFPYRPF